MNLLSVVKWVITIWMLVIAPATCDIVLHLNQPKNYGKFVEQVRNETKDPTKTFFGIPILKAFDPKNKFLYIELNHPKFNMTLQLQRKDLYVVAYRDKDGKSKKFRHFYFRDLFKDDTGEVFTNDTERTLIPINFNEDYGSLQRESKKPIEELVFQLPKLQLAMTEIYGKGTDLRDFKKRQATFLLYSIMMTSEATRFKYIEQKTVNKQNSDVKVASLVGKWEKLSVQIIGADKKTGKFDKTISIETSGETSQEIKKVADIQADMGILLNKIKK